MVEWKAIGYGIVVFPVFLGLAMSNEGWMVLLLGVPSGLAAGFRAGGFRRGARYGFVVGVGIFFVVFGGGYYLIVSSVSGIPSPGIGMTIALVFIIAVLLAVESMIAGAVGGLLRRQ